jgi:ribosomal-protein-alanine N-acetyltransferase
MTLLARGAHPLVLEGARVRLRTLSEDDFEAWQEVRVRCRDWLLPWEPRPAGAPPMREDRATYASRCSARDRERQMGTGYGFGIFLRLEGDGMPRERFVGEINLSSIQRGPFQSGHLGYWIDQSYAGRGLVPEAVVVVFRFAFEELGLHRVQVSIIPRNRASRRVAAKLGLRDEGIAVRYLEIDGRWEDHIRYAITAEEWLVRRQQYFEQWLKT